jgi:hypothetical protein
MIKNKYYSNKNYLNNVNMYLLKFYINQNLNHFHHPPQFNNHFPHNITHLFHLHYHKMINLPVLHLINYQFSFKLLHLKILKVIFLLF